MISLHSNLVKVVVLSMHQEKARKSVNAPSRQQMQQPGKVGSLQERGKKSALT